MEDLVLAHAADSADSSAALDFEVAGTGACRKTTSLKPRHREEE
jgi:hypothetical protein